MLTEQPVKSTGVIQKKAGFAKPHFPAIFVHIFLFVHTIPFNLPFLLFMGIFLALTNYFFSSEIFLLIFETKKQKVFDDH